MATVPSEVLTGTNGWTADLYIIRTGSDAQVFRGSYVPKNGDQGASLPVFISGTAAVDEDVEQIIKCTGASGGSTTGEVTQNFMRISID